MHTNKQTNKFSCVLWCLSQILRSFQELSERVTADNNSGAAFFFQDENLTPSVCHCSDELRSSVGFLHCVWPLWPHFCLVNFQTNTHKHALTLLASKHHIHPFMVDSKSEKGSKPSPSPKWFFFFFFWKLELSAKGPGTLQYKNIFYT